MEPIVFSFTSSWRVTERQLNFIVYVIFIEVLLIVILYFLQGNNILSHFLHFLCEIQGN